MNMRDASPGDSAAVRCIVRDALAEFGLAIDPTGTDADLDDIQASYQRSGGSFRVVVDDAGTVVGCGGIYPVDQRTAELRKMYFRPAMRGKGLGKTLLADLVDHAAARGFERVVLETASQLTVAIRMYERFGFIETDEPKHASRCDRTFAFDLRRTAERWRAPTPPL